MNEARESDAWTPGLTSTIPRRLQPEVTLFRPANASLDFAQASELADLSGLPAASLVAFRPERLVVHELLVRVTADYSVPDGPNYADLGLSLRGMVRALHERHVAPELASIAAAFDALLADAGEMVDAELASRVFGQAGATGTAAGATREGTGGDDRPGADARSANEAGRGAGSMGAALFLPARLVRWLERGRAPPPRPTSPHPVEPRETTALAAWRAERGALDDTRASLRVACLDALIHTVDAIVAHRGRLLAGPEAVRTIALARIGNALGATLIGERVAPLVERGAALEGFRPLPAQARPVIMNVKGASASGKSTIRPRQRELARELGIAWEDFALISPDYWRKYLLDYDSLGEDHRYGAMLCGQELALVDAKLDRHMGEKAARGAMSHLLIDRFRFDSFTLERDRGENSRLLSRFGHEVYLFFMVTPPVETVERAWVRGQSTGRYKAVDDLLHHNVEAFTGMPALFLSWVTSSERRVHFEFLDNDVPKGTLPLTGAFGWNERMTILDVGLMRDVDRFREIDVEATLPADVLVPSTEAGGYDPAFLRRCAERVRCIELADRDTAHVYARVERGRVLWCDEAHIAGRADVADVRAVLAALADVAGAGDGVGGTTAGLPSASSSNAPDDAPADGSGAGDARDGANEVASAVPTIDVARERHFTVGRWASAATASTLDQAPDTADASSPPSSPSVPADAGV